uniref:Uncharacterized protein n=1 Tax=Nicotiana tabacum TaxID=4097 RepID=A0A1S4BU71_TOBAC|nr:PREDICTED: uncharacterized protein LOC107811949 [Nicotiana tabacum]
MAKAQNSLFLYTVHKFRFYGKINRICGSAFAKKLLLLRFCPTSPASACAPWYRFCGLASMRLSQLLRTLRFCDQQVAYAASQMQQKLHICTHCPVPLQATSASGANQVSGSRSTTRAYSMRQRDDQNRVDVVIGKFHIFGLCVVTLFDPGFAHSYVCSSRVFPENVKFVRLDCVFPTDLVEMPFQDYDVIIDMDWLHRYHAIVDCRSKCMTFKAPTFSHIVIQGERLLTSNIIFAIMARKMISQGCEAYLTHVVDTHLESPSLKDIPVLCEFPDVFPENLPGCPRKGKLNFL